MNITLNDLEELNACLEAQNWFSEQYPNGTEITGETLKTVPNPKWIVWLASVLFPELGYTWAGIMTEYRNDITAEQLINDFPTTYDVAIHVALYIALKVAEQKRDKSTYEINKSHVWNEMAQISIQYLLR